MEQYSIIIIIIIINNSESCASEVMKKFFLIFPYPGGVLSGFLNFIPNPL